MLVEAFNAVFYGTIFLTLFLIDHILGNGFVDMFQKMFCKITCFIKKVVIEETKYVQMTGAEIPTSLPILLTEILVLTLTMAFLKKYKQVRKKDRFDKLLHESKEALMQTNDFLEKWRLRRVANEYTYLDDEPQEIKPLKLEVPILHMAIIDTLGTTRSQPERGDAGDTINVTDSALLSVTSLLDDDMEMTESVSEEKIIDVAKSIEFNNRYLWDVVEEDVNNLDD